MVTGDQALAASRSRVDAAVERYRADPSEANRQTLMAEQERHVDVFFAEQAVEFIDRTTRR